MERKRIIGIIGLAFCLALLAGLGSYRFLSEKSRVAENAKLQTVGIAVAVVDIPLGTTIHSNQVALSSWPKEMQPRDAFTALKPVFGRVAMRDILRGEPVVESRLVPADKSSGLLSLKVPAGMRAFSVKVNEVVGVGGFIVPDSRVDIVVTTAVSPQRQQEQVSKTFLQDVLVLAAGQLVEQKDNKPVTVNTVTLAVTPEDAEKLALASNDGKIQLVLRNFSDSRKVETPGSDKGRLLSSLRRETPARIVKANVRAKKATPPPAAQAPVAAPKPPVQVVKASHVVEVIRGGKRSEETFD
jgi:pilus assembly protein CpaB